MLGDFADVQQAVGAWEELDERAELREADDFAEIGLAHLRAGGNFANQLQRVVATGATGGEDMHGTVFEHVDLYAGLLDDGANLLAAGADQVADLVRGDAELVQARRVQRNVLAVGAERAFHDVQNL